MRGLIWFRTDLRLADNTALNHAIADSNVLFAIFIITVETWKQHDSAACKIQFILNNLREFSYSLRQQNIPLLIRSVSSFADCSSVLQQVCEQYRIDALYFNKQYELDENKRDESVSALLNKKIKIKQFDDQLILAPGSLLNQQGKPFKIFTPFKHAWVHEVDKRQAWYPLTCLKKQFHAEVDADQIPNNLDAFNNNIDMSLWPAGEMHAHNKLRQFCQSKLNYYARDRDFPQLDATSQLSPYLAQGVLSPRQCFAAVMENVTSCHVADIVVDSGIATWINELIWREFYKHIIYFYPQVCKGKAFQAHTDNIPWWRNELHFNAWCQGQTGFPFVDAGLRQLNQTGWMHNRLRMVVAMFLSKTLFLDWRLGEKYFMRHLIDGDFAANNGGWQWSASTGTDAAPYFRIFNPILQGERFDKDGKFIRQFCPELSTLDNKTIHDPYHRGVKPGTLNYPLPIVDYTTMRKTVIAVFKQYSNK